MKIYIGYDHDQKPTSLLMAEKREQADIAWAAMKDVPHSVEEIDTENPNAGVHGLVFILTSEKVSSREYDHRVGGFTFREWKRGI